SARGCSRGGLHRNDVHLLARAAITNELHFAVDHREQRVVLAPADVRAREEPGAALAHDDGARVNALATECLDAEPLRIRFAAVLGRRLTFFVRHDFSLRLDRRHANPRELVAMTLAAAILAPALELEDLELGAAQ